MESWGHHLRPAVCKVQERGLDEKETPESPKDRQKEKWFRDVSFFKAGSGKGREASTHPLWGGLCQDKTRL